LLQSMSNSRSFPALSGTILSHLRQHGEAVSGVKGELAVKLYGDDLRTLEQKAEEIQAQMATVKGIEDLGIFRIIGQPNLNFTVDRMLLRDGAST